MGEQVVAMRVLVDGREISWRREAILGWEGLALEWDGLDFPEVGPYDLHLRATPRSVQICLAGAGTVLRQVAQTVPQFLEAIDADSAWDEIWLPHLHPDIPVPGNAVGILKAVPREDLPQWSANNDMVLYVDGRKQTFQRSATLLWENVDARLPTLEAGNVLVPDEGVYALAPHPKTYNCSEPIELRLTASKKGLEVCVVQKKKPLLAVVRSATDVMGDLDQASDGEVEDSISSADDESLEDVDLSEGGKAWQVGTSLFLSRRKYDDDETVEWLVKGLNSELASDNQCFPLTEFAEHGNVKAQYHLGEFFGEAEEWENATRWYSMAARQGHIPSLKMLASIHLDKFTDALVELCQTKTFVKGGDDEWLLRTWGGPSRVDVADLLEVGRLYLDTYSRGCPEYFDKLLVLLWRCGVTINRLVTRLVSVEERLDRDEVDEQEAEKSRALLGELREEVRRLLPRQANGKIDEREIGEVQVSFLERRGYFLPDLERRIVNDVRDASVFSPLSRQELEEVKAILEEKPSPHLPGYP